MKRATFQEYEEAKKSVLYGQEFEEETNLIGGMICKTYNCKNGEAFYEISENGKTEFWSTKDSESRLYEERRKKETMQYTHDEQLAILIGYLNGVLDTYQATGRVQEHLKDKAIGFIILAEGLGIIDQDTMVETFETIGKW